jgi:serine/threonine-protein kinase
VTGSDNEFDALEQGLEAGYGADSSAPGESVLAAIERMHGARSEVILREADEGATPVSLFREDAPAVDDSRYQVHGEIARGGVGVIYRGRDKDLNRDVALKVLKADHADNPDVVQRFIEEAQVGGQLQHPGIVPIYGMGLQPDGRAYFAMKLIKGRTLSALLENNPKSVDLVSVFEQVALTMAYAHSRGVIHRDLKPANIMVGAFGEVLVVDWGFAKVLGHDERRPDAPKSTIVATVRSEAEGSQSVAGSVMGTPAYMPPEQALGHVDELDERSDVFALGAILCEILSGEAPYTGNMRDQLLAASQCRLDEAHERLDRCDAADGLKQIARDCVQPLGKSRPADASVVAQRVSDHFSGVEERVRAAEIEAIEAEAAGERARRARVQTLVLAGLALVACLGSGGGYFWWRHDRSARQAAAETRVATALAKAARLERAGDRVAAISAAREAVSVAETEQTGADEARATVARLEEAQDRAEAAAFNEFRNRRLYDALEEALLNPLDKAGEAVIENCANAFASHFGTGDDAWQRAEQRLVGTKAASAVSTSLMGWARLAQGEAREPIRRLALAIAPEFRNLRRAVIDQKPATVFQELQAPPLRTIPPRLVVAAFWQLVATAYDEEAMTLLRAAAQLHPGSVEIHSVLAQTYLQRGRFDEGQHHYTVALAAGPKLRSTRHHYANILRQQNRKDEALALWREAVRVDPRWEHGREHLLRELIHAGRPDEAESLARAVVRTDPTNTALTSFFAERRNFAAMVAEARRVLEASRSLPDPERGNRHSWLGHALLLDGKAQESIRHYSRARELVPDDPGNWDQLVLAYLRLGRDDEAFEVLSAALREPASRARIWGRVGPLAEWKKADQDAVREPLLDLVHRYLKLHGKDAVGWGRVWWLHHAAGQTEQALAAARRRVELKPKSSIAWARLAWAAERHGDLATAERAATWVLDRKRTTWDLLQLANIRVRQKRFDDAEALLKEAYENAPYNSGAGTKYIQALQRRKDYPAIAEVYLWSYRRVRNPRLLANAAWALRMAKDPQGAIAALKQLDNHAPDDPKSRGAWRELGMARIEAKQPGAAAALTKAIELGLNENWWYLGAELSKRHEPAVVRTKLRALVDRAPRPGSAWFALLKAYLGMGDFESALTLAEQTESLGHGKGPTHYARGMIYRQIFRSEDALREYEQVDPEFFAILTKGWIEYRKADALFTLGRYAEAIALLDAVGRTSADPERRHHATLVPRIPAILAGEDTAKDAAEAYQLGVTLEAKGHHAAAVAMFRRADLKESQLFVPIRAAIAADAPEGPVWAQRWLQWIAKNLSKNVAYSRLQLERANRLPGFDRIAGPEFGALLERARKATW